MNREIKFKYYWKGDWYYINFYEDNLRAKFEAFESVNKTSEFYQYINLKDKYRNEIYEGDIWDHNGNIYEVVKSDNFGWILLACNEEHKTFTGVIMMHHRYRKFNWMYKTAKYSKIIGNIHENPELLKAKEAVV